MKKYLLTLIFCFLTAPSAWALRVDVSESSVELVGDCGAVREEVQRLWQWHYRVHRRNPLRIEEPTLIGRGGAGST